MPSAIPLPTVDINCLFGPAPKDESERKCRLDESSALFHAFETVGMAYIKFNGESSAILEKFVNPAFSEAHRFFKRPGTEKNTAVAGKLAPGVTRGYIGTASESGAQTIEWKEAFSWSYNWDQSNLCPQNALEAPNVWPTARTGNGADMNMKNGFDDLFSFLTEIMLVLVDALTAVWPEDIGPEPGLRDFCLQGASISLLRAFHYHGTESAKENMTGSCQHTDWGFATLIAQQMSGGNALQVNIAGKWFDVPPVEGTLVVNCSDFLSLLTGGRLRSPLHRVLLTEKERHSFVFFQYPGFDTPVPSVSESHVENATSLSLLQDQSCTIASANATGMAVDMGKMSFGQFIARKWQQVSRT